MPDSPSANLKSIEKEAKIMIEEFGGNVGKVEIEPIAFGLKAINMIFISDESNGGTEELESKVMEIDGVNSVEVSDVRRAIG